MYCRLFTVLVLLLPTLTLLAKPGDIEYFYTYYEKGQRYLKQLDYHRAITEFQSAASLEFEDNARKRTYGTHFIEYFPHREIGICYYELGNAEKARAEIELSLGYQPSKRAKEYMVMLGGDPNHLPSAFEKPGKPDQPETVIPPVMSKPKPEIKPEPKEETTPVVKPRPTEDKKPPKAEPTEPETSGTSGKVPPGAITYEPDRVTQVGSRLSVAVLPFEDKNAGKTVNDAVTQTVLTQLVNLQRFRVIERMALDKVMQEQSFSLSGMMDDKAAIEVGKVLGADMIIVGTVNLQPGYVQINARGINTETAETVVAQDEQSQLTDPDSIQRLAQNVAIDIYNALPLVEGSITSVEDEQYFLDIGSSVGVRKGNKCVVYRDNGPYVHPTTGKVIGRRVQKLGEMVVTEVQPRMAVARLVSSDGPVNAGDKVVLK